MGVRAIMSENNKQLRYFLKRLNRAMENVHNILSRLYKKRCQKGLSSEFSGILEKIISALFVPREIAGQNDFEFELELCI